VWGLRGAVRAMERGVQGGGMQGAGVEGLEGGSRGLRLWGWVETDFDEE
jgi:hypothetical protein